MRNIFVCFLLLFLVMGCQGDSHNTYMKSIDGVWSKNEIQNFNLKIDSNEEQKNIYLLVRNNNEYPYSNIRFFIEFSNLKTNKTSVDTLNYILAKPNGEWLGSGFGNTKEILFQYKMDYKFPNEGDYNIKIKQAMRKDTLVGIEDIGIKVDNIKN